jgi:hypothetical protein
MTDHYERMINEDLVDRYRGWTGERFAQFAQSLKIQSERDIPRVTQTLRTAACAILLPWLRPYHSFIEEPALLNILDVMDPARTTITAHLLFHATFQLKYRRTYVIRQGLAERLNRTHLRGLHGRDLRLPYPAIYLKIPPVEPPLKIWNEDSGWHTVESIYVVEEDTDPRSWRLMACGECRGELMPGVPDDAVFHWELRLPDDMLLIEALARQQEAVRRDERRIGHTFGPNAVEWQRLFLFVLNVVLYATMPDARVRPDPQVEAARRRIKGSGERRRAAERKWRRLGYRMIVGDGIERPSTRELMTRTYVEGYYRQQPYGPAASLRRRQWISPHWRGPDDAPVSTTQHRL